MRVELAADGVALLFTAKPASGPQQADVSNLQKILLQVTQVNDIILHIMCDNTHESSLLDSAGESRDKLGRQLT